MISVAFDGKTLFEWEGSADDVSRIEQSMAKLADLAGSQPKAIAHTVAFHVGDSGGLFGGDDAKHTEMMALIWLVLSQRTGNLDHPGTFRDYVEAYDFDFDIIAQTGNPNEFRIEAKAIRGAEWGNC